MYTTGCGLLLLASRGAAAWARDLQLLLLSSVYSSRSSTTRCSSGARRTRHRARRPTPARSRTKRSSYKSLKNQYLRCPHANMCSCKVLSNYIIHERIFCLCPHIWPIFECSARFLSESSICTLQHWDQKLSKSKFDTVYILCTPGARTRERHWFPTEGNPERQGGCQGLGSLSRGSRQPSDQGNRCGEGGVGCVRRAVRSC